MTITKKAKKEAQIDFCNRRDYYFSHFRNLFHNSIKINNTDVPKRYLLNILSERGAIAYYKALNLFLPFSPIGIDIYGLPESYQLIGYNGFTVKLKKDDAVILRLNDLSTPLNPYLYQQAEMLADYDIAIKQNLNANKISVIAECPNESTFLSLVNQESARMVGSALIVRNSNAMANCNVKATPTGATYLIDRLQEARKQVLNETLETLGIATANSSKRERVQSSEITASLSYAHNAIKVAVDTLNYDAKYGNIDINFEINTDIGDYIDEAKDDENISENEENNN